MASSNGMKIPLSALSWRQDSLLVPSAFIVSYEVTPDQPVT